MCGAFLAAVLAIGARFGRTTKEEPRQPTTDRVRILAELFQQKFGTTSCYELVKDFPDFSSPERRVSCSRVVQFMEEEVEKLLAR